MTGQHPDLDPNEFGLSGLQAATLNCPGEEDPHRHVRAVTAALLPMLPQAPALLVVQGDTSSALGAALAGFTAGTPVAHVEAGLRTHDPECPWPEEEYRTAIDAQAELLFAPTTTAASNLRSENVAGEIHVTGNTGIDVVLAAETELPPCARDPRHRRSHDCRAPGRARARVRASPELARARHRRVLVTCHRRESWGEGLGSIAAALSQLARDGIAEIQFVLHPNPYVAGRMRALLGGEANVTLLEPCSHLELLDRMRRCDLVLSDSGGIQEEAPAIGVPLLVLRDKTERPEGVAIGNAILVGTSAERIVEVTRRLLGDPRAMAAMSRRALPYGDGHAGPRIAAIIDQWLRSPD